MRQWFIDSPVFFLGNRLLLFSFALSCLVIPYLKILKRAARTAYFEKHVLQFTIATRFSVFYVPSMGLFLFFIPLRNNYIKKTKAAACLEVFVYWVCVQCDDE